MSDPISIFDAGIAKLQQQFDARMDALRLLIESVQNKDYSTPSRRNPRRSRRGMVRIPGNWPKWISVDRILYISSPTTPLVPPPPMCRIHFDNGDTVDLNISADELAGLPIGIPGDPQAAA